MKFYISSHEPIRMTIPARSALKQACIWDGGRAVLCDEQPAGLQVVWVPAATEGYRGTMMIALRMDNEPQYPGESR